MTTQAPTSYYFTLLFFFAFISWLFSTNNAHNIVCNENAPFRCSEISSFNRSGFDESFIFGAATSAYQIEGSEDRSFNIWDTFTHRYPAKTKDRSHADLASGSLHFYEDDVTMLKEAGFKAYRFSISWSRILPKGRISGGINKKGIDYYNRLIDALVNNGIQPFVTLFHWDLPQTLQDEYGGFLSHQIVEDYKNYVDLCFEKFGDKVKHWITLNQPFTVSMKGYGDGTHAPGRCSTWLKHLNCDEGDSGTEPYLVAHNQLLAHATAVDIYRRKYKETQNGKIGITLITRWFKPYNTSDPNDVKASQRALDFMFGWFMDPLTTGEYPEVMRELVGERLPLFTNEQKQLIRGSFDFLGVNYYFTQYIIDAPENLDPSKSTFRSDMRVSFTSFDPEGTPIGLKGVNFYSYPKGLREILVYIKDKYGNPPVYITENGYNDLSTLPIQQTLHDHGRIEFFCSHLCFLKSAINNDGVNVNGYFAWSLIDNYEFSEGYTVRFGMHYIDYNNISDRRPKLSALWFKSFLESTDRIIPSTSKDDTMWDMCRIVFQRVSTLFLTGFGIYGIRVLSMNGYLPGVKLLGVKVF